MTEATIEAPARKKRHTPPEQRRVLIDQRTRIARRIRTIEKELRDRLCAQGVTVTVDLDCFVGSAAACAVNLEMMKGAASRGHFVDNEEMTRTLNTMQRSLSALGLKPAVLEPKPDLRAYLAAKQEQPA
jgi:hypothetical protein